MKRLAVAAFLTLIGCENHTGETWRVQKEMPVYRSPDGDTQEEIFRLAPGDVCYPGRVVVEKVFQYTAVHCPPKGDGWVADNYFDKSR
ncbi:MULTISPECIES: hypothetical protein [Burkholderiaceae]|uniref:hypothetical protein n=1 Tax=Burkholderiaceae TaxID=119060 RepID=UPI00141DFB18|nr:MULTISPECIES: hypothetical protein [Burkholderiaceae]MBN3850861.1 hypothetical protein [Paraburkholderia sp. Ac-20342]NIF56095.1 hypothetical protein [Burkholderia sp. Ax-1724]NIF81516.1 hypothetical protein [Paraburkholderia sp. Cy-641]